MQNKLAVITGASSGIGKSYAYKFAEMGYDLLLIARREGLLKNICAEIKSKYNTNCEYLLAELSNEENRNNLYERIKRSDVDVLINNAGFGMIDDFIDMKESLNMIKVHNEALVEFTHAALVSMMKKQEGVIINVASIAGFLASPKNAMYCATKAFVITFTESLHIRLCDQNIKFQALCPGFTLSDFHEKIGYDKSNPRFKTFMTSDDVVKISLKDLEKGKVICIPGFKYKLAKIIIGFLPRSFFYKLVIFYSKRKKEN